MNRRLALAVAATVLLAACGQSPTAAPTRSPSIRHDGGNTLGSGAVTSSGGTSSTTSTDGGNGLGSGNATGGGNGLGSGN